MIGLQSGRGGVGAALFSLLVVGLAAVVERAWAAGPVIDVATGRTMVANGALLECYNGTYVCCLCGGCPKPHDIPNTAANRKAQAACEKLREVITCCNLSFVDNGSFNYHHRVLDYSVTSGSAMPGCKSCSAGSPQAPPGAPGELVLERRHRYRDSTWISSFGPGVYCNYDLKLHLYPSGAGNAIDVLDPQDLNVRTLVDGISGDPADGVFHDVSTLRIQSISLHDASGALTTNLGSAVTAKLLAYDGTQFTFGVIAASSNGATDGAVGNWLLDETSGTTVIDSSGNGLNGTNHGCTINKPGKQNRCYQLNGTSNYIDLGNPAPLNLTTAVTVGAWVNPSSTTGTQTIISRFDGTNEMSLSIVAGQYRWGNQTVAATAAVPSGDLSGWIYMAGTFDGTTWTLYRNGVVMAQQAAGGSTGMGAGSWAIGAQGGGAAHYFTGKLDDVIVFGWTLISDDIQLLMSAPNLAGRLTSVADRNGYATQIVYKTFTPAQLAVSPELNWQIDTVTDAYGRVATFSYGATQVSGRWSVSQIVFPGSQTAQYTYSNGQLSQVTRPDGTISTFTYGSDPVSGTSTMTFHDVAADGSHRDKTIYLTNNITVTGSDAGGQDVFNQSSLMLRMMTDGAGDVRYLGMSIPGSKSNNGKYIYEGAGRMKEVQDVIDAGYLQDGWTLGDPTLGAGAVTGTLEATYGQVPGTITDGEELKAIYPAVLDIYGVKTKYTYDADGYPLTKTWPDNTVETWTYNGFKQVTRYQDRLLRVTLYTYDTQGNLLKKETGILNVGGTDTHQPEYAFEQWQYYASGDPNQFLLQTYIDQNGNATSYAYSAQHLLTTITEPADSVGAGQGVTTYTYDALGRPAGMTDQVGRVTSYAYDACNRLIQTTYADGSTERAIYGAQGTGLENLVVRSVDRNNVVTDYAYDAAGRVSQTTQASGTLDALGNFTATTDPTIPLVTYTYLTGTDLPLTVTSAGETTTYVYDYRQRVISKTVQPQVGATLTSASVYSSNLLAQTIDPYGRNKYNVYRTSDSALIRMVQGTVPSFTTTHASTINRASGANATYLITDYVLDAEQQMLQLIDPLNTTTANTFDSRGRIAQSVAASGTPIAATTQTVYDAVGNVLQILKPRNFSAGDPVAGACYSTMTYTARNLLASRIDGAGTAIAATTQYTYNLDRTQNTKVDPRSNTWTTLWSACCAGRVSGTIDPAGNSTSTEYDQYGSVTHMQTIQSPTTVLVETTTSYDARHRPTYQTVWLVSPGAVNPQNPPIAGQGGVPAANGLTTAYQYDENMTDGVGLDAMFPAQLAGLNFGAGSTGSATLVTKPAGERTLMIQDGLARTVRAVQLDATGASLTSVTTTYDALATIAGYGAVVETAQTDALSHTTRSRSDAGGRLIQSVDAENNNTNYTYDANRNMLSVRDPNSVGQNCVYDALNRQTSCTDTFGATTSTGYDADNNVVTQTDAKGNNTTIAYDARDRKTSSTDRIGGVTQWTYDGNNNLLTLTDAETQITSYVYDVRNLKTTETYADGGVRTFAYDGAMRMSLATDQQGDTLTPIYDQASRLLERDYRLAANSPAGAISDSDTFTYDPSSHMLTAASGRYTNSLTFTYDLAERMTSEALTVGGQTYTVGRAYDQCSRLTQITYPDGAIATQAYTARDQLQSVSYNAAMIASMTYDPGMRESSRTFGNGLVTTTTYRTDNLVSSISTPGIPGFSYTYDANKNKTAETATGNLANYTWNTGAAGYDNDDQLTNWSRSNGDSQTWALSLVGDWNSTVVNGANQARTFAPVHEMVTVNAVPLTYDPKGNLTQRDDGRTFVWDFDNRPASTMLSGATASYTYDALGRRVSKTVGGATTVYICLTRPLNKSRHAGQEIAEYASGAAPASPQIDYVFGAYIDDPLAMISCGATYYYHKNNLYCVEAITSAAAAVIELYAYNAYGQAMILAPDGVTVLATSSVGNPFSYTGRRLDSETGLYYYRARYYDSAAGRFVGRDPIGFGGDDLNLYRYVRNKSMILNDPAGLCQFDCRAERKDRNAQDKCDDPEFKPVETITEENGVRTVLEKWCIGPCPAVAVCRSGTACKFTTKKTTIPPKTIYLPDCVCLQ